MDDDIQEDSEHSELQSTKAIDVILAFDGVHFSGQIADLLKEREVTLRAVYGDIPSRLSCKKGTISVVLAGVNPTEIKKLLLVIAMLLYGYIDRGIPEKYGIDGRLMSCAYTHFYDKPQPTFPLITASYIPSGSHWENNSCYLDSVMMIVLLSDNFILRQRLFEYIPSISDYHEPLSCDGETNMTKDHYLKIALTLQQNIKDIYAQLICGTKTKCIDLRRTVGKCRVRIMKGRTYNAAEFYDTISGLIPSLNLKIPMKKVIDGEGIRIIEEAYTERFPAISITDFMIQPYNDPGMHHIEIIWSSYDDDYIVFTVPENPVHKFLFDIKDESKTPKKIRVLGDIILDGSYKLSGVVMYSPSRMHYTCLFRNVHGHVISYDDMDEGKLEDVGDEFPKYTRIATNYLTPAMYFYKKIYTTRNFTVWIGNVPRNTRDIIFQHIICK